MNNLLNELLSDLENEELTPHRIELCIRKLAAILNNHEAQITELEEETSEITENIPWSP